MSKKPETPSTLAAEVTVEGLQSQLQQQAAEIEALKSELSDKDKVIEELMQANAADAAVSAASAIVKIGKEAYKLLVPKSYVKVGSEMKIVTAETLKADKELAAHVLENCQDLLEKGE